MSNLNAVDYGVMSVYFCALVALGIYLNRKASSSLEDYFLGGRRLPWWALGISGMANWLDVTNTSLIVAFLFMLGMRGIFVEIRGNVGIIMVFMLLWTGKWHRRSQCMTGAEWMVYRFGDGPGGNFARLSAALATVIMTVGMLALLIKGVGLFYALFLPFKPFWCSVIIICIATLYTIVSGFYGVVYTDIFQSGIIMAAVIGVCVMAFVKVTGVSDFAQTAAEITHNPNWIKSSFAWNVTMPEGFKEYESLGWFLVFYMLRNLIGGLGAGADPKYFGARSDRECGLLSFLWTSLMTFRWPMAMGFAILGIFLVRDLFPDQAVLADAAALIKSHVGEISKARWPDELADIANKPALYAPELIRGLEQILGADWGAKLNLVSFEGTVHVERILPAVILFDIPLGFRGLIIVALLAASMSTFDSQLNATTGYFVRDLYQRYLRPNAPNRELMWASYLFGIVIVLAAFGMAYTTTSINEIWEWVVMALGGGFIIPTVLRFHWWRFNGGGFAAGTVAGMIGALLQRILVIFGSPQAAYYPYITDTRWVFGILVLIGTLGAIIGTFLTPPTNRKVLEHFYRTTRPWGLWHPLTETLDAQVRRAMLREHFFDLICVPFVMVWQVTMYMLPMQFLTSNYNAFWVTFLLFAGCLTFMYFFWYRKLPPAEPKPGADLKNRP